MRKRKAPWRGRVLALLARLRLRFRERCVMLALIETADQRGACWLGNDRLASAATRAGLDVRRPRARRRPDVLDGSYFCRVLRDLIGRGLVTRTWFPSPAGKWFRSLRVREDAILAAVHAGALLGRPWDSRFDPVPSAVADRVARAGGGSEAFCRRARAAVRRFQGGDRDLPRVELRCVSRPAL